MAGSAAASVKWMCFLGLIVLVYGNLKQDGGWSASVQRGGTMRCGGVFRQNSAHSTALAKNTSHLRLIAIVWIVLAMQACTPSRSESLIGGDIRPPMLVETRQESAQHLVFAFDEPVRFDARNVQVQPSEITAEAEACDREVKVRLEPVPRPGDPVVISGTFEDVCGNSTRIQVQFTAFNDHPARLAITEVQAGKNSSKKAPHRDYLEFLVLEPGNLGGMTVQWASTTKLMSYAFPACEVGGGEVLVLHLAPEGIPDEKDETGTDINLSGGIDASAAGRDFWSSAGGLPDASGAVCLFVREGGAVMDGLFYSDQAKSGAIESAKLTSFVQALADAGKWKASRPISWEDGVRWKPSVSKPLCRIDTRAHGAEWWTTGESGSQTPGSHAQ